MQIRLCSCTYSTLRQPLQERRDREGLGGRRRDFRGSRSRGKAQEREALVSRLEDEGVNTSFLVPNLEVLLQVVS